MSLTNLLGAAGQWARRRWRWILPAIAALCLGHGVRELWSADRDFSRFPDLRVRNPLV